MEQRKLFEGQNCSKTNHAAHSIGNDNHGTIWLKKNSLCLKLFGRHYESRWPGIWIALFCHAF
jgi:hypothetical protein